MKKVVLLFVLVISCSLSSTAQDIGNNTEKKGESRFWGEGNVGIGKTLSPLMYNTNGETFGVGQYSSGFGCLIMYSLMNPAFSVGGSLHYTNINLRGTEDEWLFPGRIDLGPAVAYKKYIKDKQVAYIVASAGLKWDEHYKKNLPSGYQFCQNTLSMGGSLSAAYIFRINSKMMDGLGIKGTVFSYGNSREARNAHIKDPIIDGWEISLCWYLTRKTSK